MTQPILPKLKDNHNVKSFKEPGKWDVRHRDSLLQLSNGLKVNRVDTEISSIPDMWARPILFDMALRNREHVLYERIRGEWRGVLAMLALKEVLGLTSLTAQRIVLPTPPPSSNEDDHDSAEVHARDLVLTLARLSPRATLALDTTWQTLYVFLFDNKPFAITSPTTLVATATDYLNRVSNQEVGWFDGTRLKDPVPLLPPVQKQILSGWVTNLISLLERHESLDMDRWNSIASELRAFKQELGPGVSTLSQSAFAIHGSDAGVFRYLDKPAQGIGSDASHVQVIPSETRSPRKPLLIFDRGIAEQWNMPPQNVTVSGAQTLASIHVVVPGAEVWKREDFFTQKLFVISQENALPATTGPGNQSVTPPWGSTVVTPILPINATLLQYLSADSLAQRVRWDNTPDGLRIHLFIQVSGPDPGALNGRTVELTKVYRRHDVETLYNVPILEVWPNFRAAGWKSYYTCYSTENATSTFLVSPFTLGGMIESEVSVQGLGRRLYWSTEQYPEAMICKASVRHADTGQLENLDAGILLLNQPDVVQPRDLTYKIGVDFGAASTTVCVRLADQPPYALKFKNRNVSITASGEGGQAQLFNFFLPGVETEMPVLSFFQSFDNNPPGTAPQPFLHGHIYLLPGVGTLDPNQKGMAFDLKWSSEQRHRRMVKAFLMQLCLQALAELVEAGAVGVSWSFSYPTAFSDEQLEGFPEIWNQVTNECSERTGLSRVASNSKQTESVATALYFVNRHNAATRVGTIFIDIGGSTSDISVWQDDAPVWQTSVLFAGRDLFSNYLWHNPSFLGLFGSGASNLSEEKAKCKGDRKPYYALTDALLRYNSELIFAELPVHAATGPVRDLRQHLALGISGLCYYVGSLLQHLVQIGICRGSNIVPNIYVGGNGSRIFRWLDIDGEERINALYKAVFSRGANWPNEQPFKVILTHEPKLEAAYGLVSDRNLQGRNLERQVLAGETFVAEGSIEEWPSIVGIPEDSPRTLQWNSVLTAEAFTKRLMPPPKLDRLTDFISAFNTFARNKGLISVADLNDEQTEEVRRRLGQTLGRYQGVENTSNILVEPVFIIALRHWLEIRLER